MLIHKEEILNKLENDILDLKKAYEMCEDEYLRFELSKDIEKVEEHILWIRLLKGK